jgi:cell division protein FtsW
VKRSVNLLRGADTALPFFVAGLMLIGLVMIYSSSQYWAYENELGANYYFVRQSQLGLLGVILMVIVARIDYRWWQRLAIPVMFVTLPVLVAMLVLGKPVQGAVRFVLAGSIQPSEMAKLGVIIYIAAWLVSRGGQIEQASYGVIPFAVITGVVAGLIMMQPDLGTAMLVILTTVAMFFVAGAQVKQILLLAVFGTAALVVLMRLAGHEHQIIRFADWLQWNPLSGAQRGGWLGPQSVAALRTGRFLGVGLGQSERAPILRAIAHTDAIFAILGEELGFVGAASVLALFVGLGYRGYRIAIGASDQFGMLLAAGVTTQLMIQAAIHVGVAVGLSPETGITLPFVSYGGSSLVTSLIGVGLLLSISRGSRSLSMEWQEPTSP